MKFRKKLVVIDAIQWTGDNFEEVYEFMNGEYPSINSNIASDRWQEYVDLKLAEDKQLKLKTLVNDGEYQIANKGDWIIRETAGVYYSCKSDIFDKTYEKVEEDYNLIPPITIDFARWQVENLRMYFGGNDKSPTEHWAFKVFDNALNKED